MNSAVVDTNVLIAFLEKGSVEARVLEKFDKLIVPAAVDAEFRAGLDLTTKTGRRYAQILDDFLNDQSVAYVPADRPESLKYAMLYRVLKKQGTPIPINDIWIASAALVPFAKGSVCVSHKDPVGVLAEALKAYKPRFRRGMTA